jgi:DNA-binding transcriptional ArsR family regulator
MLRPITVAPTFSNRFSTIGELALTSPPSSPCVARNAYDVDVVFHALADPSRRAIVERPARGSATVSDLADPLPMSMPAVLQHLQVLERSGLVRSRKTGRVRTCSIEIQALSRVQRWIDERQAGWERRLDRLDAYLAEEAE